MPSVDARPRVSDRVVQALALDVIRLPVVLGEREPREVVVRQLRGRLDVQVDPEIVTVCRRLGEAACALEVEHDVGDGEARRDDIGRKRGCAGELTDLLHEVPARACDRFAELGLLDRLDGFGRRLNDLHGLRVRRLARVGGLRRRARGQGDAKGCGCRNDGNDLLHGGLQSGQERTGGAAPKIAPPVAAVWHRHDLILDTARSACATDPDNLPYRQQRARDVVAVHYIDAMSTEPSLLIDLAGVARLADVKRPVASVWRTRFASSTDPFPAPVSERAGRAFFDALEVAQWLVRTDHGNNPDAVADAAAAAAPDGFDRADLSHVAAVDALLALAAASGTPIAEMQEGVQTHVAEIDPSDVFLATEVAAASPEWHAWADQLADAAYSPLEASRLLERGHLTTRSRAGSSGPLHGDAEALTARLVAALFEDGFAELSVAGEIHPRLAELMFSGVGQDADLLVSDDHLGRWIRRRLLCDGIVLPFPVPEPDGPRLSVLRLPTATATSTAAILHMVDELALDLRREDRAVVIAPSWALTDGIVGADAGLRAEVLRSGFVRAIVKLPAGLVASAPRESLTLWVLGREIGDVPVAERFTAVADLSDVAPTDAAVTDLISDVLAALGSARDVRAHAFRFTRLVRTTSLLAAEGALTSIVHPRASEPNRRELPVLLDHARVALGDDAPRLEPVPTNEPPLAPVPLEQLLDARHVRLLPGTRIGAAELGTEGLVVIQSDDLERPGHIGERRIDPLVFASSYPNAQLTAPGDVVFRTAPTARAWVDPDGAKVVCAPARILRVDAADPGGLVPEVVAADIDRSPAGPGSWRRWRLRRVAAKHASPLRRSLEDLAARRQNLEMRITALDAYADLLVSAVASGTVTLAEHSVDAAAAASDSI